MPEAAHTSGRNGCPRPAHAIGGDDGEVLAVVDHGGVITHALMEEGCSGEVLRQVVDHTELAEPADVGALWVVAGYLVACLFYRL